MSSRGVESWRPSRQSQSGQTRQQQPAPARPQAGASGSGRQPHPRAPSGTTSWPQPRGTKSQAPSPSLAHSGLASGSLLGLGDRRAWLDLRLGTWHLAFGGWRIGGKRGESCSQSRVFWLLTVFVPCGLAWRLAKQKQAPPVGCWGLFWPRRSGSGAASRLSRVAASRGERCE